LLLLRRGIIFILKMVACSAFACVLFFALLSLWGIVVAPFVRLESASFLIVTVLAVSGGLTVLAYGAFSRWLSRGKGLPRRR
jgi:hypothetical protein